MGPQLMRKIDGDTPCAYFPLESRASAPEVFDTFLDGTAKSFPSPDRRNEEKCSSSECWRNPRVCQKPESKAAMLESDCQAEV